MAQKKNKSHSDKNLPIIKEIKSDVKIIPVKDPTSLEDEVAGEEKEKFASFVNQDKGAPVIRTTNSPRAVEVEETQQRAPQTAPNDTRLYSPRSSTVYTPASGADNENRIYEDPMVSATRRISQVARTPTLPQEQRLASVSEPSLGMREQQGLRQESVRSDEQKYSPIKEREERDKKRRYAWEA